MLLMRATVLPRGNREDDFGVTLPVILGGPAGRVRWGTTWTLDSKYPEVVGIVLKVCLRCYARRSAGNGPRANPAIARRRSLT